MKVMKSVEVSLMETSTKLVYDNVINTYTKGPLYCIMLTSGKVIKFPIEHIFTIIENDE